MAKDIEEYLPAFSTWKMFNETVIPTLSKMEYSENGLQKLASILKTKEFINIVVYNHDPKLTYDETQNILRKYKIFTVWLLGRLFYYLSCEKLSSIHDLIIKTQWRILFKLSVTQPHLYEELSKQYADILSNLNDYYKNNISKSNNNRLPLCLVLQMDKDEELQSKLDLSMLEIKVFSEMDCVKLQKKLIKLLDKVIYENVLMYYYNSATDIILDNLLYMLSECNTDLRFMALETYVNLLRNYPLNLTDVPFNFLEKFNQFVELLEPLTYDIYNKKIIIPFMESSRFEKILMNFLLNVKNLDGKFSQNVQNISFFLIGKEVTESIQNACCDQISKLPLSSAQEQTIINLVFKNKSYNLMKIITQQLFYNFQELICTNQQNCNINLFHMNFPIASWVECYMRYKNELSEMVCRPNCCQYLSSLTLIYQCLKLVLQLVIQVQRFCILENVEHLMLLDIFSTDEIFHQTKNVLFNHRENCGERVETNDINDLLLSIFAMCSITKSQNQIKFAYHCITIQYIASSDYANISGFHEIVSYILKQTFSKTKVVECLSLFMNILSSGLLHLQTYDVEKLQSVHTKVVKTIINEGNVELSSKVLINLLQFPRVFHNQNQWIQQILFSSVSSPSSQEIVIAAIHAATNIICESFSRHILLLIWNSGESNLKNKLVCVDCTEVLKNKTSKKQQLIKAALKTCRRGAAFEVFDQLNASTSLTDELICRIIKLFNYEDQQVRISLVKSLKSLLHSKSFHTIEVMKSCLRFALDDSQEVRREFQTGIGILMAHTQHVSTLSQDYKNEVLLTCFKELKIYVKKSLQSSNYDLQYSLLETLRSIANKRLENVILNILQLMLYFIMIPTSKHSSIASSIVITMASELNKTTNIIFSQYKKELSQTIVELCAINQALLDYSLSTSLEMVSLVFGYFGTKDFVTQESKNLLPIFISLIVRMPKVEALIHEMAKFMEMQLSDLLTCRYGNIFLHIFLNEPDEVFKQCMTFVEKNTELKGNALRKCNFQIILNELLLNFSEKQERVLFGIRILAREDSDSHKLSVAQIPEYLQPRFLGVLAYFDMKLISQNSAKKKVLLSLAQLLRFMGPKHITPLRFKILAMLKTVLSINSESASEINCEVWDSFIKSCDIDALGPQLASVFISLMPILEESRQKIEEIFRYLIIHNEVYVKDYIPDLFFVTESNVDHQICTIIKKHLERIERMPFKEQLKWGLKYLNHETIEIRVCGLKHLKKLLEKNREELDQMILGYNGIDPIIVELLDILMLRCREKDDAVKLACAECIGELGAIEPSHLPRRFAPETKLFSFFITEDAFIVNALNELIRALQEEKHTQNIDRFSLAIQEILKVYGISPDVKSPKHNLWVNFPDAQRELMLPLLSSRYTMAQPVEKIPASPIYGSKYGNTFQTWIYNWTCNLILAIKSNKKSLLQVCTPSLKQDDRTLMSFLPHILLHALLENKAVHHEVYNEFIAITNIFSKKHGTPLEAHTLDVKSIYSSSNCNSSKLAANEESKETQCTKVIFVLLDFLDRWAREWNSEKPNATTENIDCEAIQEFLSRFCKLQLASCNYHCGEYPRALMYLEEYIKEQPEALSNQLSFLSELYAQMDEPDGVTGVTALQVTEPPLEQRLLASEVSGKLADAAACYEGIHPPLKPLHIQGLVKCYLDLDNVNTALNFIEGAIRRQPEYKSFLLEVEAEPLWRLSRFDELDNLLKKPELQNNNSWGVQIGRALLNLKNGKTDEFKTTLDALRLDQVESLSAASLEEGAYQHGYSYISKLHTINELQQIEKVIHELIRWPNERKRCESIVKQLASEWELRLKIVQESLRIQEPILCLRRVAVQQAKEMLKDKVPNALPMFNSLLGESWMHSVKIARAAGAHQQAYTYTLKAEEYVPPHLFLEKARLHWLREEHEQALTTLRRGIELLLPEDISTPSSAYAKMTIENRKIVAEAKLLIASYNDSISNVDTDINTQHYKESVEVCKEWEKGLVCLAQYYDRIFQTLPDGDKDAKGSEIQIHMINYFGKSLAYGTKYVYQSMPRLLGIWFDYGTRLLNVSDPSIKEERSNTLLKMTKLIDMFLERLPSYVFLTAFSQLVSRICHPQKQVYIELKSIIIKLILQYPQQSLWMIISVVKSSYSVRSKRCAEILNDSRLKTASMLKLVGDFTKLAEKLIELCNKEILDNVHVASVNSLLRTLPRLLTKGDFSEIMIPTQKSRKLILPNPDFQNSQHNPFPNHYVHIVGIEDEVTVLQSLQRPRRITFKGSDGKLYIQMLKPKDDLRKDSRLMEFNDIVNQLLSQKPESRQRRLNIRLYSVVPLNEECGLIEWIPNMVGLRPILMKLYKQKGLAMKAKEVKQYSANLKDSLTKKREIFLKCFLPKHPPVLSEWFRKTFPDAQGWLTARTTYIRTTAVMSMVGYILGLGDRHGENILFDSTSGDIMHVDFNCLFNKGESFEWPERVPFRLTHNMVAVMGPLRVEGVFRKSCACTLEVLRSNSTTLMSIVTPFVYDPLVSWSRNPLAVANAQTSELTNEKAMEHIRNIQLRLQGIIRTKGRSSTIPLSVEGQTNILIQEAMSVDNLCQMYFGWGPYL